MQKIGHQGPVDFICYLCCMIEAIFETGFQCDACLSERVTPPKKPLMSHDFPLSPWSKVEDDICHFEHQDYNNYIGVA